MIYKTRFGRGLLQWRGELLVSHRLPGRQRQGRPAYVETEEKSMEQTAAAAEHTVAARNLAAQLEAYFSGRPVGFDPMAMPLEMSDWSGFEIDVAKALAAVPYGSRVSYGRLAALAGHPGAHRAVGNFLAKNPFPVILPCHRVILASGKAGNFSAGATWKQRLLELEGILI